MVDVVFRIKRHTKCEISKKKTFLFLHISVAYKKNIQTFQIGT